MVDAGVQLTPSPPPTSIWSGLDHLEGEIVAVIADGEVVEPAVVAGGQITARPPRACALAVTAGLPFTP